MRNYLRVLFFSLCLGLMYVPLFAQEVNISGTVSDESGEPLPGVTVIVEGTTTGTTTNIEGIFRLSIPQNAETLTFSSVGYTQKSVPINNQTEFNVSLQEDIQQLGEVVVNALGFKENRDQLGSTASRVDAESVVQSGETGVINGLAGKAASVRIARSNGDPGAGSTIQIRGANTITGSSNPLVIVDGVPLNNNTVYGGGNGANRSGGTSQQSRLNDINPNDIESIQVLKGASAASLWGSRAANGVIVITTKQGSAGRPKISFSSTYSIDEVNTRHPLQNKFGQGRNGEWDSGDRESWGDKIAERPGGEDEVDMSGEYFEADDGTLYYPIINKNSRETYVDENFDEVFQNGYFLQNDLSISGGSEKSTFFFSLGRLDQEGIVKNSDYHRTNVRLNNQTFFADWINVSSRAAYTNTKSNRIQQSSNVAGLYLGLLRNPPDFSIADYKGTYYDEDGTAYPKRHRAYRRPLGSTNNPIYNNPLWTTNEQISNTLVDRFIANSDINIEPNDWLVFTLRGGVDTYTDRRNYFYPIGSGGEVFGRFDEDIITESEFNFDAIGKAQFSLTDAIGLTTTIGWNYNNRVRRSNFNTLTNFQANVDLLTTDLNTSNEVSSIENFKQFIRSNRLYSVFNFDFFDQLYFNASGTVEAASSVQGNFFYPAFDVAWQFTELAGLDNTGFLSFGKLRASWGQVGVQPQAHRFQTLAEGGFVYSTYDDGLDISQFGGGFRVDDDKGNPDLKPEIKTEWEIGTDLRFMQDRLSLSMTYYQNEINDLLFEVATTPSSGFLSEYTNAGVMQNRGFEAELDYAIFQGDDFTMNAYANFNTNENEVVSLQGTESVDLTTQSISSRAVPGYPLGVLWGTRPQRNDDGSLLLDDNGFPQIANTQGVIGDPNPDWRGGLGLRASYKNISFNILFEHSQGGDFAERTRFILRNFGTHADVGNEVTLSQDLINVAGDVIPSGTTVRGAIEDFGAGPVLLDEAWYRGRGAGFGDGVMNEFAVSDATWTRLREIRLGYVLNNSWLRDVTKLNSVEFSVTGRNLFLWTDILGIDPEINQFGVTNGFGIDYFTNPSTRSVLFTLKINY
ncbi:TonB-linked SusC/RagA family outer membrane protein [Catalinimonas alkaloidigena]|uniref:SusC/RagA family TonB-linked outer membrane protein n=1 Tax=Catalinimonas alkaloidigena TaxID=1075417 RepID=UPI002405F913|nr:SusC/RagA family TonB-linked outer membrane protein [Catalinimonas alkaloidigena]MDF9798599.1 TonB-linked SusC/RagA family outer membrane protein [Catalinimonas alkaloidigena]